MGVTEKQELTQTLCDEKIKHIDDSLAKIQMAVEDAFSHNKDATALTEQLKTIFSRIWGKCIGREDFIEKLGELSEYFENLENSVDGIVDTHLKEENIDSISENIKKFYRSIVQIYFAFAKQKFLLNQLKNMPYRNSIANDIKLIKTLCKKPADVLRDEKLQRERYDAIQDQIDELMDVKYELYSFIKHNAYPNADNLEEVKKSPMSELPLARKIRKIIADFPESNQLHDAVNKLNQAISNEDKKDNKKNKKENEKNNKKENEKVDRKKAIAEGIQGINALITKIQKGKNNLERCYKDEIIIEETIPTDQDIPQNETPPAPTVTEEEKIIKKEEILEKWSEESEAIANNIAIAEQMPVMQLIRKLTAMMGENQFSNFSEIGINTLPQLQADFMDICTKQSNKKFNVIPLWSNRWNTLATSVKAEFDLLSQDLNQIVSIYQPHFNDINEIRDDFKVMDADKERFDKKREQFVSSLDKVKYQFQATVDSLTAMQEILSTYLELPQSYIKQFLSNHWLLMVAGGTLFGGVGTAIAILTFTNPIVLTAVAGAGIGFLFGVALGAAIGLMKDEFCTPKPKAKIYDEKQLFKPVSPKQGDNSTKQTEVKKPEQWKNFLSLFKPKPKQKNASESELKTKLCP